VDGDPSDPGDWLTSADKLKSAFKSDSCVVTDSSWHGTQTAALVGAATNNGVGMASVGRHVMVLPVRVLGKCGGFDSDIIAGMRWAAGLAVSGAPSNPNPARVINLSLGSATSCDSGGAYTSTITTLNNMGVVVVVSAGNDDLAINSPANCSGAIAVAGLRHAGTKSGYSSLGPQATIAAPGGNCLTDEGVCQYPILSASNTGTQGPETSTYTSGLGSLGLGTSFSAPLVAGSAALMLAANPTLTAEQVKSMLRSTARAFPITGGSPGTPSCGSPQGSPQRECYCTTTTCGAGMLDTAAAVRAAAAGRAVAHVGGTAPVVSPGNAVTLDGSASSAASGATLATYAWDIVAGSDAATITSATNASTVTLSTDATKTGSRVTVRLTVTDSLGNSATATQTLTLGTPPTIASVMPPSQTPPADSGGGGGAPDASWALLALAAAGMAWQARRRRE
jgi:serine protease